MAGHRKKKGGGRGGGGAVGGRGGGRNKGGGRKFDSPRFVSQSASRSIFKASEDSYQHWSMTQEARNTERHLSRLDGSKLRHKPVTFVSGGTLAQQDYAKTKLPAADTPATEAQDKTDNTRHADIEESTIQFTDRVVDSQTTRLSTTAKQVSVTETSAIEQHSANQNIAIEKVNEDLHRVSLDISHEKDPPVSASAAFTPPAEDAGSSDLSEDEVVFRGRNAPPKVDDLPITTTPNPAVTTTTTQPKVSSSTAPTVENGLNPLSKEVEPSATTLPPSHLEPIVSSPQPPSAAPEESAVNTAPAWAFEDETSKSKTLAHRPKRQSVLASESEAESDILRDYIENLDREGMYVSDDSDSDDENDANEEGEVDKEKERDGKEGNEEEEEEEKEDQEDQEKIMIDNFDEVSTSDELPINVAAIHSIRARTSGTQYLVTEQGRTIEQAKWVSKEYLLSHGARDLVDQYLRQAALSDSDDDGGDENEDEDEDEGEGEDDEDDDGDILDSNDEAAKDHDPDEFIEQLDDEQLACALAKQEELGYLGDDVMIFDGTEDIDFTFKKNGFTTKQQAKKKRKTGRNDTFPSASAFVDVLEQDPYDAFDVMDFDVPSLRKRNKGKKQFEFDLSDDELAWQMQASWENDRKKKAAKKREREELRHQGLLGSKNGKPDMNARYSTGMTIDDVKKELRLFLLSSTETLSLPPMGKKERKIVHEMAHMLNLKSLSRGNGKSRFPTLTKTTKTSRVRASELDNFFSSSKVLRRLDRSRSDRPSRAAGGTKAASYEHGEVVGARAPEIGAGNKGRAMLEKMGWSSGTALGADNNKGILEPVSHVVRKGKAGLG